MNTRVLTIVLGQHLKDRLNEGVSKVELADAIGVSTQKLTRMTENKWEYITRNAIEKAAAYLKLEVQDIFQLVDVDFWKSIKQTKRCVFVRGSQRAKDWQDGYVNPWYDDAATLDVKEFLRESLSEVENPRVFDYDLGHPSRLNSEKRKELMKQVKNSNCVVIGGPRTNGAAEILLTQVFDARPFEPSDRPKIPFGFCWGDEEDPIVENSTLTCSSSARQQSGLRPGIAFDGFHIEADFYPQEEFMKLETNTGRDCGLVLVANRPFGSSAEVKLIVVAGFGGVGTIGAASALIKDFRYLEPIGNEKYVYGVVEVIFSKKANSGHKKLREFNWKYRKGGHSPLAFEKVRSTAYKARSGVVTKNVNEKTGKSDSTKESDRPLLTDV